MDTRKDTRYLAPLVVIALGVTATPGYTTETPVPLRRRAVLAAHFIVSRQLDDGSIPALSEIGSTADAVVSLVAARRAPDEIARALDFLEANAGDVDNEGEKAKVALALVAGGRDPREFAGRDLVAEMEEAQQPTGRYGATTSVFSHASVMLALQGAGGSATLTGAALWLIDAQCDNGGWQFLGPATPVEDEHCSLAPFDIDEANTDTTALAVQALEGIPEPVEPAHDPFTYFEGARDGIKGGWGYDRASAITNANSTGMVLQAYGAAGRRPPAPAPRALVALQGALCGPSGGAFFYSWTAAEGGGYERVGPEDLAATIAALPGLLRRPLPMPPARELRAAPSPPPC